MFLTPERCEQITFSEPTYGIGQAFLIQEGNPKDINNYDDVAANSDVTLAVMGGAIEGQYAQQAGVPDGPAAGRARQGGRHRRGRGRPGRRLCAHQPHDRRHRRSQGEGAGLAKTDAFSMVAGENVKGHGGFGFRNEDAEFVAEFNQKLAEFIGTPEHLALVEPFGFGKDELPELTRERALPGRVRIGADMRRGGRPASALERPVGMIADAPYADWSRKYAVPVVDYDAARGRGVHLTIRHIALPACSRSPPG